MLGTRTIPESTPEPELSSQQKQGLHANHPFPVGNQILTITYPGTDLRYHKATQLWDLFEPIPLLVSISFCYRSYDTLPYGEPSQFVLYTFHFNRLPLPIIRFQQVDLYGRPTTLEAKDLRDLRKDWDKYDWFERENHSGQEHQHWEVEAWRWRV